MHTHVRVHTLMHACKLTLMHTQLNAKARVHVHVCLRRLCRRVMHIYIYIYICVCVCVCVFPRVTATASDQVRMLAPMKRLFSFGSTPLISCKDRSKEGGSRVSMWGLTAKNTRTASRNA